MAGSGKTDKSVIFDLGRVDKPSPALALRLAAALADERFDLDPAQAIFIDDHADNGSAARRHGWQALHFRTVSQAAAELATSAYL